MRVFNWVNYVDKNHSLQMSLDITYNKDNCIPVEEAPPTKVKTLVRGAFCCFLDAITEEET
jgi:hypothetical protein